MKKIAETLIHNRNEKTGSMLHLQLRKKSLKEGEQNLLLKNKNITEKVILFQLSLVLSPNRKNFG
jgi:hypothetical protein